jgi:hypothetical protein
MSRRLGLAVAKVAATAIATVGAVTSLRANDDTTFFESKIRPLLSERCYECHSAGKKQKGNLLLDTKEGVLKGGDTGAAIVPGDPAKSLLIEAVKWTDKDLQMPPKKQLSSEEIADLEKWIQTGAADPRTGERTLSKIEQHLEKAKTHWAFQPVLDPKPASLDALIGGKPSAPADKRTLCRRAYLDLLGVPPTYAEVTSFIADNLPDAFARLVDKLLADPRYGERWGRHWLDVARYADNDGQNGGGDGTFPYAYTYRDYVIHSFNEDKPYDRFLIEQIAADQVETAKDVRTLSALGFLIVGWRKDGRIDDDTLNDTIDVLGRGLMGLTIGCARCHDHKLEPITTKDYYGLYGVLKSCKEPDRIPILPQPDTPAAQEFRKKNLEIRMKFATESIQGASQRLHTARSRLGDYLVLAEETVWKNQNQNQVKDLCIKRDLVSGVYGSIINSRKPWIEAHPEVFGPFLEFITKTKLDPAPKLHPLVAKAFATPASSLEEIGQRYNEIFSAVDGAWRTLAKAEIEKPVELTQDEIDLYMSDFFPFMDTLQPRFFERLDALEAKITLPDPDQESLRQVLIAPGAALKIPAKTLRGTGLLPINDDKRNILTELVKLTKEHPGAPPRPMAFVDADKPYNSYVFVRGDAAKKGPEAPRQFLTALRRVAPEPFPKEKSGRLELAKAIASKENPLTARVIVNRVWAWHFGTPIVPTPSDFGFQGERPTNQPLLDHLAAWFMEHGWSFKRLHRYLMLSAAYQRADFPMQPLELEPFRDSVLAVSGRLDDSRFGKPKRSGETTRRTVYDFVDRKTLPALYRSFDFPNPNFSASMRTRTALAPRALILMNSPLIVESAKALAASLTKDSPDEASRIEELYHRVFQRNPDDEERKLAHDYMAAYPPHDLVHPETQDWEYGYGTFDSGAKTVKQFSSLTSFDGKSFKGAGRTADGKTGGVMLDAMGGNSGPGETFSTIRRWVAPLDGRIDISAELTHSDDKTDGVIARVASSRTGLLGEWSAKAQSVCTDLTKIEVRKGDTLDFIVSSANGRDAGAYRWSPSIVMPGSEIPGVTGLARRWDARVDFADPNKPPRPLTALEELCQALLLSPEFSVVE